MNTLKNVKGQKNSLTDIIVPPSESEISCPKSYTINNPYIFSHPVAAVHVNKVRQCL